MPAGKPAMIRRVLQPEMCLGVYGAARLYNPRCYIPYYINNSLSALRRASTSLGDTKRPSTAHLFGKYMVHVRTCDMFGPANYRKMLHAFISHNRKTKSTAIPRKPIRQSSSPLTSTSSHKIPLHAFRRMIHAQTPSRNYSQAICRDLLYTVYSLDHHAGFSRRASYGDRRCHSAGQKCHQRHRRGRR